MPRNGTGIYSLPEPPFSPGTVISSAAVNSDLNDIALALTDSISADGQTPITGALKLADGSSAIPSYSFVTNSTDGIFHPGSGQIAFAINGVTTLTIQTPSGANSGLSGVSGALINPIGMLADYAGAAAPSGWFFCYGQAVSRTTYADLFTAVGTVWGAGDGSTTFNLPDLRGRTTVGKDDMGGVAANRITNASCGITGTTLGATGGDQNLATHGHTTNFSDPGHTHVVSTGFIVGNTASAFGVGGVPAPAGATNLTVNSNTTGITVSVNNAGTGSSANVPPAGVVNKIIFAGHP